MRAALLGKTIRQRAPDRRVISFTIAPDDIVPYLIECRPVYVVGNVFKNRTILHFSQPSTSFTANRSQ